MFNRFPPPRKSCRLLDNLEKYCTVEHDNIIRRMRSARWITKATDTHSEFVIHIALLWQQSLRERASIQQYTYFAFVLKLCLNSAVARSVEVKKVRPSVVL